MLQFFGVAREYLIINPIKLQIHQLGFAKHLHGIGQNFREHGFVHGFVNFKNPYQIPIHGG